jgi:hypothetical protein
MRSAKLKRRRRRVGDSSAAVLAPWGMADINFKAFRDITGDTLL